MSYSQGIGVFVLLLLAAIGLACLLFALGDHGGADE